MHQQCRQNKPFLRRMPLSVVIMVGAGALLLYLRIPRPAPLELAKRDAGRVEDLMARNKINPRRIVLDVPTGLAVKALVFSAKGELLAVAAREQFAERNSKQKDDAVQLWDVERGTILRQWQTTLDTSGPMAISTDGSAIAMTSNKCLVVWQAQTGQELWRVRPYPSANAIQFSPDGKLLVTAGPYGIRDDLAFIDFWDTSSGKNLASHSPGIKSCDTIAFSADGSRIAVAGLHEDSSIASLYFFGRDGRKVLGHEYEPGDMGSMDFAKDGAMVATGLLLLDARTGTKVRELPLEQQSSFVAGVFTRATSFFHPDGKTLIVNVDHGEDIALDFDVDQMIGLFRTSGEKAARRYVNESIANARPKGERKVSEVQFWDYRTAQRLEQVFVEHNLSGSGPWPSICALSADGTRFALCRSNVVHVVEGKQK